MTREEIIERYESKDRPRSFSHRLLQNLCPFQSRGGDPADLLSLCAGQTQDERFRNFDGLVRELSREALSWLSNRI